MLMSEMPERWAKYFPPIKKVCQSEYSAMYDCIASGLEDIPRNEQLGVIRGMLQEFLEWAEVLLKDLPDADGGPWLATVRIPIAEVLQGDFCDGETLLSALVNEAARRAAVPEEYADVWTGSAEAQGEHFVVTLFTED